MAGLTRGRRKPTAKLLAAISEARWRSSRSAAVLERIELDSSLCADRDAVLGLIGDRLPVTIELVVIASVISGGLGVPIGVFSAVRQGGASDYAARTFAILGLAIPSFVLGILTLVIFSRWFGISFAIMEKPDIWEDPIQNLQALMMPALVLGFGLMGGVMRMARSATLEVLHEDYVRTARAKGLGERVIITRHVLRNVMIPILTIFGNQIAFVLGGTVIVEQIFGVHGLGELFLDAISLRNYPVVMGMTLLLGSVVVATNLLVDLSYAFIDPRVKYR